MDLVALIEEEVREECTKVHHKFKKMAIMLGISPKNAYVIPKYMAGSEYPYMK
jgi:hypothetical protein